MAQLSTYPTRTLAKVAGVDASGNVGLANAPVGVFYAGSTFASVLTAAALANSAGGGFVDIPAGIFMATEGLPAYPFVRYRGAGWGSDNRSGQLAGAGGTIFVAANSSIIGYGYNTTDLGVAPTDFNTFVAGMLIGAGLSHLTFVGFSYGVKIGAKYNPGMQSCFFDELNIINSVNWDFYVENYWCCEFEHITIQAYGVGAINAVGSGATALNCGNSIWKYPSVNLNNYGTRGICFWGRSSSEVNQDNIYSPEIQTANSAAITISQAATMANASANIGVTDSTKFPVGMPVTFSASVNGFIGATVTPTVNQTYFILTSAANVVTVGLTTYGSAVVATGNTAVNIQSKGFPHFEVAGLDAASSTTAINIYSPDTEGFTSARFFLQNTSFFSVIGGYIGATTGTNEYATFVLRGSVRCKVDCLRAVTFDINAASNATIFADTAARGQIYNIQNFVGGLRVESGQTINLADQAFLSTPGANALALQNGTSPQNFQAYNTFTSSTNGEWIRLGWNGSNQALFGTDKGSGGGSARGLYYVVGGTIIGDMGISVSNGFTFNNLVNSNSNFVANNFNPPITGSFAGTGLFYTHKTSTGTIFVTNATGANYGSIGINGAQLWGLGSSTNGTTQSTNSVQWDGSGNAVMGNANANATNATDGFLYIPTCAGTPTGVPTAFTGKVAMIYDTTNNKFYIYNGGWKGGTTPGAFT